MDDVPLYGGFPTQSSKAPTGICLTSDSAPPRSASPVKMRACGTFSRQLLASSGDISSPKSDAAGQSCRAPSRKAPAPQEGSMIAIGPERGSHGDASSNVKSTSSPDVK